MPDGNLVAKLGIGLTLKDKGFNNQLSGTLNKAKAMAAGTSKAFMALGGVIAAALSVKAVISFGASCLELGSNLAEVQNVVDTVFPEMNQQANNWAKTAMHSFGMSETVAKNYMSTLGAMSRAFGYSEAEAYAQATSLTGLAGDMASFYNRTTDETFTALKAVYSGETEVLKQYGIVMSESALNEFALQQGIQGSVKSMTDKEKVALRLAFVQDRMSMAAGDFAKTESSWANQTRILSLQWDAFKASIGQGLINVLTPVIQWLNAIMEAAQGAAQAFANFTAALMGVSTALGGGASSLSADMSAAAEGAEGTASGLSSAGGAAKKLKGILAGFDKLNILNSPSGGGGGGGGGASGLSDFSFVPDTSGNVNGLSESINNLKSSLAALFEEFKEGFKAGFGNFNFDQTISNLQTIRDRVNSIFASDSLQQSASNFVNTFSYAFGEVVGSAGRIAGVTGQTFTGGLARYLTSHESEISSWFARMFDLESKKSEIIGNLSVTVADIYESVFGSTSAESIVSSLLGIAGEVTMTSAELGSSIGLSLIEGFNTIIQSNSGGITTALQGTVDFIASCLRTVERAVTDMGNSIRSTYDEFIGPTIATFSEGVSSLLGVILDFWNTNVSPILDEVGAKFSDVWDTNLKPMFDSVAGAIGRLFKLLGVLWTTYLVPIINWIVANILPVVTPIVKTLLAVFMDLVGMIGSGIRTVMGVLNGLLDFITGVLTGNWSLAWEGIKGIFSGAWDGILGILNSLEGVFDSVFNGIVGIIRGALNLGIAAIESFLNSIVNGINAFIGLANAAADAVPGFDGSFPTLGRVSLPRLAQGGYVDANTPQLAIVGDNRHEGEIIAPESKIEEAVARAITGIVPAISNAVARAISQNRTAPSEIRNIIELDGQVVYDTVQEYSDRANSRGGGRT